MEDAFVGIDVAFAKRKRLPVCICTHRRGVLHPAALRQHGFPKPPAGHGNRGALDSGCVQAFAADVVTYLLETADSLNLTIRRVALDCPSSPKREGLARRAAEVAMDRRRISCFATPSESEFSVIRKKARAHLSANGPENRIPHANQLWMLVGFELFTQLGTRFECREVFPQAIVATLGASEGHKTGRAGYKAQLRAAAKATGTEPTRLAQHLRSSGYGSSHDRLDAYLCAWIASLTGDELEGCGKPPDDVIWVPRGSGTPPG
jgi:hypothetical protein